MARRKDGEETKARILDAACDVFGEAGYHDGTHAEICRRAGVNTAAINYHFGEKASLYRAAFEHAVEEMRERYPLNGNLPDSAPPARKLHAAIKALLARMLDPDMFRLHKICIKELFDPSNLLEEGVANRAYLHRAYIRDICRDLLGHDSTEKDIHLCGMSVSALCRMPPPPPIRNRLPDVQFTQEDIDSIADHITRFSLAGIRAMRRRIEARES